ncbi:MAG: hypothetical protein HYR63_29380 [Proteobacteria bacterium]|nr:hypothetical protein [Pseudomonadota bacterium]
MLRASSDHSDKTFDLRLLLGAGEGDGGVAHGRVLVEFAEAVLSEDGGRLDAARGNLLAGLGGEALVDASGIVGLFDAIDRVADATGIPLEEEKAQISAAYRAELGIDEFASGRG